MPAYVNENWSKFIYSVRFLKLLTNSIVASLMASYSTICRIFLREAILAIRQAMCLYRSSLNNSQYMRLFLMRNPWQKTANTVIVKFMKTYSWWFKQAVIAILSIFFLILGVETLVASYRLPNPLNFIMAFFSASLIILLSIVGILYPLVQVYTLLKPRQ